MPKIVMRIPTVKSRTALAREVGDVVYAVRCRDGAIKIGWTSNIRNRIRELRVPLDGILALVPGTLEDEQAVHAGLVEHRAHGREFYHPTPEVIAVVNEMRATYNLPLLAA